MSNWCGLCPTGCTDSSAIAISCLAAVASCLWLLSTQKLRSHKSLSGAQMLQKMHPITMPSVLLPSEHLQEWRAPISVSSCSTGKPCTGPTIADRCTLESFLTQWREGGQDELQLQSIESVWTFFRFSQSQIQNPSNPPPLSQSLSLSPGVKNSKLINFFLIN